MNKLNLIDQQYKNVQWVLNIPSNKPWKNILISALTHGWETAWLDVIDYLLWQYEISKRINSWSITMMLSNIDAYQSYLEHWDFMAARYLQENMNRCATVERIANPVSPETRRINELVTIIEWCDLHVDLHSTTMSSMPIAIYSNRLSSELQSALNVSQHCQWIIEVQVWKPLIDIIERNWWTGIGLELWKQSDKTAFTRWVDNILRILEYEWLIDLGAGDPNLLPQEFNKIYQIYDSIVVSDVSNFKLTKDYQHGEQVNLWDIIAYQWTDPIVASMNSTVILPTAKLYPWEEYCFLAKTI